MILHLDFDVTITDADPNALNHLASVCQAFHVPIVINTARLQRHCDEILPHLAEVAPLLYKHVRREGDAYRTVYFRPSHDDDVALHKCVNLARAGRHRGVQGGLLVDDNPENVAAAKASGYHALYTPRGILWDHVDWIRAVLQSQAAGGVR